MKIKFYLIINVNGTIRTTKTQPDLKWNEVAILVNLELPLALFQRPTLEATLQVPDSAVHPTVIPVETRDNIKDALESATGMEVRISFAEADSG